MTRHAWTALCWAVIALGLVLACSKPKPKPPITPPAPPAVEETGEEMLADLSKGHVLEGFARDQVPTVLYFPLNSAELLAPDAYILARHLKRTGQAVRLEGHACPLGTDVYNEALSYHRAMAVRAVLVAHGVLGGRIEVVSFGEAQPVTLDPGEFHRNRRVEVILQ